MLDIIIVNLSEIFIAGLVAVVTYILSSLGKKVKELLDDKKIREFVEDTVRYVNQAYETLENETKFEEAHKQILDYLNDEGLKITEAKLRVLIESAVNKLK